MKRIVCILALALTVEAMAASTNAPFRFSGKVVTSDGRPIAGATVARYEYATDGPFFRPGGAELALSEQVTTQADGSFILPLPRGSASAAFLARKPGLAPSWRQFWNVRKDQPGQQLVLASPTSLAGTVVDEADKPVANAEVFVYTAVTETLLPGGARTYNYLTTKLARDLFTARTGIDGRFRIEGLPADAGVDLAVKASGKALRNPGRESTGPDTMPWHAGDQAIKLIVEPAGSIEGKIVVQDGGQPLEGVHIFLQPQQGGFFGAAVTEPTRSKADGTFKITDVAAASYRLRAIFGTNALPDWVAETVPVTVEVGQAVGGVRIAAVKGGLLQASVTAKADHQPLANAMITAYRENFQATAKSATNGIASLRLLPGDYNIAAYRDNWRADNLTIRVQAGQSNRVDLELSPPPKITGIVRRPDGQPAAGAEVRIIGGGPIDGAELMTDNSGRFEAEWDPRNYGGMGSTPCLLVRMPQNGWAVAQDIDAETGPLDLRLATGLTLVGQVKTPAGLPITNATAALVFWTGNSGMHLNGLATRTNLPGHFEIPALPPGRRYGVYVGAPGFGRRSVHQIPADTEGKVELDPIELNLANLKLAGQLLDSEDKPVAGASVNLQGEGQPNDHTRTDREGRFKFDKVCEGPVQIYAHARNSYGNASAQGGETNVIIRLGEQQSRMSANSPPPQKIKGTVTGPDGKPAIGARVRLFSPMNFSGQWTRVDGNGAFRATSNPMPHQMGSLWMAARDATGKLAAAAEVPEGDTPQMDLKLKMGGVITGGVQDAHGKPVAKATLELMVAMSRMQNQWDDRPLRPDAQGHFEIAGLPTALSYYLFASAPGYGRTRQELTIEESSDLKVSLPVFALKPANLPLAGQVVNEDQKPVANAQVQVSGDNQPQTFTSTDRQGRFKLQVCEGPVRLFVHMGESFGNSTIDGGETNALITLTSRSRSFREPSRRRSLQGNRLPDLTSVGLAADALPAGKPGLLFLLDFEQRSSRRALSRLSDEIDALKLKGLAVAAVQATPTGEDTWEELKSSVGSRSFVVGQVTAKSALNRWATETTSLPWLILTDKEGRVAAEGFNLDDLETKLETLAK